MQATFVTAALAVVVAASLSIPTSADDAFQPITSEGRFRDAVVDRKLAWGGRATMTIGGSGRVSGIVSGRAIAGAWEWRNSMYCRELDGRGSLPSVDCETVALKNETVRFTGDAGQGTARDWRVTP